MLYETPATISFTVKEGKDIQQKGYVMLQIKFFYYQQWNQIRDKHIHIIL